MWPVGELSAVFGSVAIHPPEQVSGLWLVAGVVLVVMAVALPLVVRLLRRRSVGTEVDADSEREARRREQVDALDRIIARWEARELSAARALEAASRRTRTHIGVLADVDLDVMTLVEIERVVAREPRLQAMVDLERRSSPFRFAHADPGTDSRPGPDRGPETDAVCDLLRGYREVVAEWT